jgi:hypothetical protein
MYSLVRKNLPTILFSATGVSVAIFPGAVVATSARMLPIAEQGVLSIALSLGTFAGQIAGAAIVEARLTTRGHSREARMPNWLSLLAIAAAAVTAIFPTNEDLRLVTLPLLLVSLTVGRMVSVVQGKLTTEMVTAVLLIVTGAGSVLLSTSNSYWAFPVLVIGPLAVSVARSEIARKPLALPSPASVVWVVADAGTTGLTQPVLNGFVLEALGPGPAVAFKAVSTVSAAVEPFIAFVRVRLLKADSKREYWLAVTLVVSAVLAIMIAHFTGLIAVALGRAWSQVTWWTLLAALLARAATLLTTPYFASLRRQGRSRFAFILRVISTAQYMLAGVGGALIASVGGVFAAYAIAECLNSLYFRLAASRRSQID